MNQRFLKMRLSPDVKGILWIFFRKNVLIMKKLFTIDDIMVASVSALGYGFGYEIPKILDMPGWMCLVLCMAVGLLFDVIVNKIVFSKAVQKKRANKVMAFCGIILFILLAEIVSSFILGKSMLNYVIEEAGYVVIFPVLGFFVNMAIRWYQAWKIRKRYGDGSRGFVFDVNQSDLDEINRQNQKIEGDYDQSCAVKTRTGIYMGEQDGNVICFSGIPYAKAPVGERRWKAPEPLPTSGDVFEAKTPGASAIQVDYDGSILKHHRQSEDCLTLNICVASEKSDQKKPVLVLFHNGDFSYGGSADPLMQGDGFIKAHPDVIGVSFNYRLGLLGFIDFSEVPGGEAYPDALNLGLLDQIAALKWIRENIAAFGGDPDRITVMGFESGAISISLLAVSPQAKGLFQKAFVFFGSPDATVTAEYSRNLTKKLMEVTSATNMEALQHLSTEQLKEATMKLARDMSMPVCDGKLIPEDVYAAYQAGAASGIEFIIGIARNERQIYKSVIGQENYEQFINNTIDALLQSLDESHARDVIDYIEAQKVNMPEVEARALVYEQCHAVTTYNSAKKLSAGGNRVHLLYWNAKPLIENLGSGTVDVVTAFLGNSSASQMYGTVLNSDISETLQSFLMKYINGKALKLYENEIKGMDAMNWKSFPKALIVDNDTIKSGPIEDKLTEIKSLWDLMAE